VHVTSDERIRRQLEVALGRPLSRRDILRLAAYGSTAAGAAAFLAACSPGASTPPAGSAAASASAAASGSALASTATGRTIKIGYVSPKTGPLAPFAEADEYIFEGVRTAIGAGVVNGTTTYPIEIVAKDSQSDPNRAAEVAGELITDDEVDVVLVASTPETTNPVADQCEANGVPCISSVAPWQPYFFGRQPNVAPPDAQPFEWTYHFFWGLEDIIAVFLAMWSKVETNKVVGALWPNDGDGNAWGSPEVGFPPAFADAGYTLVDPGRYENGTQDFSAQINAFKTAGVEIVTGVPIPPDFTTFWNQAAQQDFHPKIASVGKALLFPASVDALADIGEGLSTEVWWTPSHPFNSSLTGASAKELADGYTAATTRQWTQPIGFGHALFEVAADVLGRASSLDDKAAIRDAIKDTNLDTIVGKIQWTGTPTPNVAKTPLVGGQWKKGTDFAYDLVIVNNEGQPDIPTGGTLEPIPS
jgi:branched-chain amino acid transport system substrate-binding protein